MDELNNVYHLEASSIFLLYQDDKQEVFQRWLENLKPPCQFLLHRGFTLWIAAASFFAAFGLPHAEKRCLAKAAQTPINTLL